MRYVVGGVVGAALGLVVGWVGFLLTLRLVMQETPDEAQEWLAKLWRNAGYEATVVNPDERTA